MKWYYWLGGVLIAGVAAWYFIREERELKEKMKRVREAKALKKDYETLNDNDDVFIRKDSQEVNPQRDERAA